MVYPIAIYPIITGSKALLGFRIFCVSNISQAAGVVKYKKALGSWSAYTAARPNRGRLPKARLMEILKIAQGYYCVDLHTKKSRALLNEWGIPFTADEYMTADELYGAKCIVYNYDEIDCFYDYFRALYPNISGETRRVCEKNRDLQISVHNRKVAYIYYKQQALLSLDNTNTDISKIYFNELSPEYFVFDNSQPLYALLEGHQRHQPIVRGDKVTVSLGMGQILLNRNVITDNAYIHRDMEFNQDSGLWVMRSSAANKKLRLYGFKEG